MDKETKEIKEALLNDFNDFIVNAITKKELSISELKNLITTATELLNIELSE